MRSKGWWARSRWQSQAQFEQPIDPFSPLLFPKERRLDQQVSGLPDLAEIAASSEPVLAVNTEPALAGLPAGMIVQTTVQNLKEPATVQREQMSPQGQLNQSMTDSAEGAVISCYGLSEKTPPVLRHKVLTRKRSVEAGKVNARCLHHYDEVNDCKETVEGLTR